MTESDKHLSFIEALRKALESDLPGEEAQWRMAPSFRGKFNWKDIEARNPRISGVLLMVFLKKGEWQTVLMKRVEYTGVHSAQISLPGGKFEEGDDDIVQTALREAEEETGVLKANLEFLGQLSRLYIPPSNFIVYPTVAFHKDEPEFVIQEKEVQYLLHYPLKSLLHKDIIQEVNIDVRGEKMRVPAFIIHEEIVWGATAIILSEFIEVLRPLENLLNAGSE